MTEPVESIVNGPPSLEEEREDTGTTISTSSFVRQRSNSMNTPNKKSPLSSPKGCFRRSRSGSASSSNSSTVTTFSRQRTSSTDLVGNHKISNYWMKKRDRYGRTLLHRLATTTKTTTTPLSYYYPSFNTHQLQQQQRLTQIDQLLKKCSTMTSSRSNKDLSTATIRQLLSCQDDESGYTVLHKALYEGNIRLVLLLLRHAHRSDLNQYEYDDEEYDDDVVGTMTQRRKNKNNSNTFNYIDLMEHCTVSTKDDRTFNSHLDTEELKHHPRNNNNASKIRSNSLSSSPICATRPRSNSGADKVSTGGTTGTKSICYDILNCQDLEGMTPFAFMSEVCSSQNLHYTKLALKREVATNHSHRNKQRRQQHFHFHVDDMDPMAIDEDHDVPTFRSIPIMPNGFVMDPYNLPPPPGSNISLIGSMMRTGHRISRLRDDTPWNPVLHSASFQKCTYGTELVTFGAKDHVALGQFRSSSKSSSASNMDPFLGSPSSSSAGGGGVVMGRVEEFAAVRSSTTDEMNENGQDGEYTNASSGSACQIAVGPHHTLVATSMGHLYVFGLGNNGRLGLGKDYLQRTCLKPQRIQTGVLATKFVTSLAAGESHSLCTTSDGEVYAWGSNRFGQLGLSSSATSSATSTLGSVVAVPTKVEDTLKREFVVNVAAGDRHSVCLSKEGQVFCFGCNKYGQLGWATRKASTSSTGGGKKESGSLLTHVHTKPGRVDTLWNCSSSTSSTANKKGGGGYYHNDHYYGGGGPKVAIQIAASDKSTLVLVKPNVNRGQIANSVYSWGNGNYLPLRVAFPLSNNEESHPFTSQSFSTTKQVSNPVVNPIAIACAKYHNVAITDDGEVYTWGLSSDAMARESVSKGKVSSSTTAADGGGFVTVTSTSQNSKRSGGGGGGGFASSSRTSSYPKMCSPQLVKGMSPKNLVGGGKAIRVAASEHHTAVITTTGHLYTWGASNYGNRVLGHEGTKYQPTPKRVQGVFRAIDVAVSREHSALLLGTTFPSLPSLEQRPMTISSVVSDVVGHRHNSSDDLFDDDNLEDNNTMTSTSTIPSLQTLSQHKIASEVDLFNVLPTLLMSERLHATQLTNYCHEFIRQNLDTVLALSKPRHLETLLEEGLMSSGVQRGSKNHDLGDLGDQEDDDDTHLVELCLRSTTTSGNPLRHKDNNNKSANDEEHALTSTPNKKASSTRTIYSTLGLNKKLDHHCSSRSIERKVSFRCDDDDGELPDVDDNHKDQNVVSSSSMDEGHSAVARTKDSLPSLRAVTLARQRVNLNQPADVLQRYDDLAKAVRSIHKKLNTIQDYKQQENRQTLSQDQMDKLAREPELQADRTLLKPLLDVVTLKMEHFNLFTSAYPRRKLSTSTATTPPKEDKHNIDNVTNTKTCLSSDDKKSIDDETSPMGTSVATSIDTSSLKFRCDICDVICPNQTSLTLHLSGRKHRNCQRRLKEQDIEATHNVIRLQGATTSSTLIAPVSPAPTKKDDDVALDVALASSPPRYSLAPLVEQNDERELKSSKKSTSHDYWTSSIPRKTQASLVQKSLSDIMKEEEAETQAKARAAAAIAKRATTTTARTTKPQTTDTTTVSKPAWGGGAAAAVVLPTGSASLKKASPAASATVAPAPLPGASIPAFKWSIPPPPLSSTLSSTHKVTSATGTITTTSPGYPIIGSSKMVSPSTKVSSASSISSWRTPNTKKVTPAMTTSSAKSSCNASSKKSVVASPTHSHFSSPSPSKPSFSLADLMDQRTGTSTRSKKKGSSNINTASLPSPKKSPAWGGASTSMVTKTNTTTLMSSHVDEKNAAAAAAAAASSPDVAARRKISFNEIQRTEEDFKAKADSESGIVKGKWHIERRERANSLGEIQRQAEEQKQYELMIEEQKQIEAQIIKENAEAAAAKAKAEAAAARKKKNAQRNKKRNTDAKKKEDIHKKNDPKNVDNPKKSKDMNKDERTNANQSSSKNTSDNKKYDKKGKDRNNHSSAPQSCSSAEQQQEVHSEKGKQRGRQRRNASNCQVQQEGKGNIAAVTNNNTAAVASSSAGNVIKSLSATAVPFCPSASCT